MSVCVCIYVCMCMRAFVRACHVDYTMWVIYNEGYVKSPSDQWISINQSRVKKQKEAEHVTHLCISFYVVEDLVSEDFLYDRKHDRNLLKREVGNVAFFHIVRAHGKQ